MGDAETTAASAIITKVLYRLRDPDGTVYNADGAYAELLGYLDTCLEDIHEILVNEKSELARTGTGTITTAAGTQSYVLADNSMGDFWTMERIWVSTYEPMEECTIDDLHDVINLEEDSQTAHRCLPTEYCLQADSVWFRESPDDTYTVYLRYYPNYVPLTGTTANMPYRGLFNNEIIQGTVLLCKHRNEENPQIDAVLKDLFHSRAMKIMNRRRKKTVGFKPKV